MYEISIRTMDKEMKKKLKSKIKEESVPSDSEELVRLFRIESNTNRLRGRGKGRGRGRGRSRGNGWTYPMEGDSDIDNGDSSDSVEHELNQNQRHSSRLSHISRSTEDNTIISSESGDESRKSRNRRREKRGNRNSSQSQSQSQSQKDNCKENRSLSGMETNSNEEFEEESVRKRSLKQELSSVEEKRRRRMSSKEESLNGSEKNSYMGRTMREITNGRVEEEGDSMEEEENMNGNCPTIITKNNKTVTLPDLNPPPLAKMSSLRVHIGCGLCMCRHTSDMVICNRCGDEFHASCLYGNEMDYNNWLCSECACILLHLNEKYSYLRLGSEVLIGNIAPMGCPNRRFESMENIIEEKRLRWLLKMGDSLIGSRVWFHEVNVMGRILRRLDDLLLYYVTFDGLYWKEEGWYALEKSDIGILSEFVWIRKDGELHLGVKVNEFEDENEENGVVKALDLITNKMVDNKEYEFEKMNDWREHKFELVYTPLLDTIRWEIHVKDRLNRLLEHPLKVLSNRSEMNAKEWMYKWIYMWSREVDFPLGGWARGVVLHYRSITGKHFVYFENEEVPSSWFYLNGQYIVVEGVNNE